MTIDTLSFQRTTDTLSLFQQGQLGGSSQSTIKADSDSLQLAQIHSAQEVISGFEGTPIPYSPRSRCSTKSFTCWERNFFPRAKAMEERKKQASKVSAMASSVRGE